MLPAVHRLRRSTDFLEVTRSGTRGKHGALTVHVLLSRNNNPDLPRVGVVASKAVGNAVERHAVARRIRHAAQTRIAGWPAGSRIVIRALPGAGQRSWATLLADLDSALGRAGLPRQ